MFYSGIADEAGQAVDTQIRAHKELGWSHIELRKTDGKQFTDATDAEFDAIRRKLDAAGIRVSCFASPIANWATKITQPIENDIAILERAIPRMKTLGTSFIRVMGWPNDGLPEAEWRARAVSRMKELTRRAEDGGITLVLENCDGWPSRSAKDYGEFFSLVGSPALKAVYDTGNAPGHKFTNVWEWYQTAKPHIAYIHIKAHTGFGVPENEVAHVWPDDPRSASMVPAIAKDLFAGGYDGGFSIEPHMKAIIHLGKEISNEEAAYQTYVEHGRRMMKVIEAARG
jgi:sugar phosphate isomerase/epimerase